MPLDRLGDDQRGRDQRHRAGAGGLAQAGVHLPAHALGQQRAELEQRAPAHGIAGQQVLADHLVHEAGRRDHLHPACLHVGLVDDAAHAAEVVDMAVAVDHGHHRLLRPMLEVQRHAGGRHLGADQRVDHDQAGIALDDRHVGDVDAAHLPHPVDHLEQAGDHVDPRMAPQAGVHAVGRGFLGQEAIGRQVPHRAAVGAGDGTGRQVGHMAAAGVVEAAGVGQRQPAPRRMLAGPRDGGGRLGAGRAGRWRVGCLGVGHGHPG